VQKRIDLWSKDYIFSSLSTSLEHSITPNCPFPKGNMSVPIYKLFGVLALGRLGAATGITKPPCLPDAFTPYKYVGCYLDERSDRTLPDSAGLDFGSTTIEKCAAACKANGYHYAGLEYYGNNLIAFSL